MPDSSTTLTLSVANVHGSTLSLSLIPGDTGLLAPRTWTATPSNGSISLSLQGIANAFGHTLCALRIADSSDALSLATTVSIASRNDAPTFRILGSTSLTLLASAQPVADSHWIDSIKPGPANESSQSVAFEVEPLGNAAEKYASLPSISSAGTLSFTARTNSSGKGDFRIRAKDDGGHAQPGSCDTSAWDTVHVTFNMAPSLVLSEKSLTTYEGIVKSLGTLGLSDDASVDSLTVSWSVSDSLLLPHDNIALGGSGTTRNLQATPAAHKWGSTRIRFTVSDKQGGTTTDSLILTVSAVNHAPVFTSSRPKAVYSYKAAQALGTVVWDDVATTQKGRMEVTWSNVSDSALASIRLTSGVVSIVAKQDTMITLPVRLRFVDSSGTSYGGVDTAWTELSIPLVDTVQDAEGHSYKARVLGTQTWMRSNLQTTLDTNSCLQGNCATYGRGYTWAQSLGLPNTCDTTNCSSKIEVAMRGLCPSGWHVPAESEWRRLISWAGNSDTNAGITALRAINAWDIGISGVPGGIPSTPSTDYFGFSLLRTSMNITSTTSSGRTITTYSPEGKYGSYVANGSRSYLQVFGGSSTSWTLASSSSNTVAINAVRCIKDTSERDYFWISP